MGGGRVDLDDRRFWTTGASYLKPGSTLGGIINGITLSPQARAKAAKSGVWRRVTP